MPERYNCPSDTSSFSAWVLAECLGRTGRMREVSHPLVVELRLNGIDLPFKETLDFIASQLDTLVSGKAEGLIREPLERLRQAMSEAEDQVVTACRDAVDRVAASLDSRSAAVSIT